MSRPKSSSPPRHRDGDEGPRLPALIRLVQQSLHQELARWLGESRWADLQPAHCAATQALWSRPDGERLTVLAQQANITKQSMGALIDHLSRSGYVERVDDPDDGRASRLRLTARGRAFVEEVRGFARRVEAAWAARVGARRVEELRHTLTLLLDDATS